MMSMRLERMSSALEQRGRAGVGVAPAPAVRAAPAFPALPAAPLMPSTPAVRVPTRATWTSDETITRDYFLPEGRLEALTELMVRSDVPILVTPKDDRIQVHATEAEHHVFKLFVDMICAAEEHRKYELSEGKLEALTELMVRPDVPIIVSPGDDSIGVNGTSVEQDIFEAFVNMIEGKAQKAPAPMPAPAVGACGARARAQGARSAAQAGEPGTQGAPGARPIGAQGAEGTKGTEAPRTLGRTARGRRAPWRSAHRG